MAQLPKHQHVIGLDILRLLAASLVMCYHFGFWNWTRGQPLALALPGQAPAWGADLHFGWVGVEVFFVISGFVIAYTASDAAAPRFLRGRFLRLAPVNWLAATVVLCVLWAVGDPQPNLWLRYGETLLFWPLNAIGGVWWTLGIEIDFYLLTYLLIRRDRVAMLEPLMIAIGVASGLFWIAALSLQYGLKGYSGLLGVLHGLVLKAEGNRELQLLLVQHGCFFALGVVGWRGSVFGLTRGRVGAMAVLAGACLLEIVGENGIIGRASQMELSAWPAILAWVAAMAVLAVSVAFNPALARGLGRGAGVVRFAGLMTYPLYLLHNAIGVGTVEGLAPRLGLAAVGVGLIAAFAVAAGVARWVEPWFRGVIAGWLAKVSPVMAGRRAVDGRPFADP